MALIATAGAERLRDQGVQPSSPNPKTATAKYSMLPMLTAPMASSAPGAAENERMIVNNAVAIQPQLAGNHRPGQAQRGRRLESGIPARCVASSPSCNSGQSRPEALYFSAYSPLPNPHCERRPGPTMLRFAAAGCQWRLRRARRG